MARERKPVEREKRGWAGKPIPPDLYEKLKPLARQMRQEPTQAENKLWQYLRKERIGGYKFRRQHPVGRFIVDFYCSEAQLVIEVDGPTHQYTSDEDFVRQTYLESLGLRVARFTNTAIKKDMAHVLERIEAVIQAPPPDIPEDFGVG